MLEDGESEAKTWWWPEGGGPIDGAVSPFSPQRHVVAGRGKET